MCIVNHYLSQCRHIKIDHSIVRKHALTAAHDAPTNRSVVGEDGGEEWGERIEEACEQEGDGGEGGGVEEGECSVIVGEDGGEEWGERSL